jgi:hypothetical protein
MVCVIRPQIENLRPFLAISGIRGYYRAQKGDLSDKAKLFARVEHWIKRYIGVIGFNLTLYGS